MTTGSYGSLLRGTPRDPQCASVVPKEFLRKNPFWTMGEPWGYCEFMTPDETLIPAIGTSLMELRFTNKMLLAVEKHPLCHRVRQLTDLELTRSIHVDIAAHSGWGCKPLSKTDSVANNY